MPSTFFGFEVAKSGLITNQIALNVTAHNMANADTKGYTRQRIDAQTILPYGALTTSGNILRGTVGGGVMAVNVEQIRDLFLDNQLRGQASKQSTWEVKANTLLDIESMFDETSKSSITGTYQNLLTAFQEIGRASCRERV